MLVLSRKKNEVVMLGSNVEIHVVDIRGDKVRLAFKAPKEIAVHRGEIARAILRDGKELGELVAVVPTEA